MIDPVTGQMIVGIANTFMQGQTNQQNQQMNEQNNRTQIRLQQEQNQFNQQMWHQNNLYNSPINQMDRLRKAGLNPALAYGGNVANVSQGQVQQNSKAQTNPSIRQAPQFDAQIANVMLQQRQLDQQEQLIKAQAEKTQAEADQINASRPYWEQNSKNQSRYIETSVKQLETSIEKLKSETSNMDANTIGRLLENKLNSETFDTRVNTLIAQYRLTSEQSNYVKRQAILASAQLQTELLEQKLLSAKTDHEREQIRYTIEKVQSEAQSRSNSYHLTNSQINKLNAETGGLELKNLREKVKQKQSITSDKQGHTMYGAFVNVLEDVVGGTIGSVL